MSARVKCGGEVDTCSRHKRCSECRAVKRRIADFWPRYNRCEKHREKGAKPSPTCEDCKTARQAFTRQPRCHDCEGKRKKRHALLT